MTRESACASAVKHISQRAKSCHPAFFQAEDGIRDSEVTGVQTCALPIRSEEHTSELQSPQNLVCRLIRSEEHTSELQSPQNLVCRLLLEKKKNNEERQQRTLIHSVAVSPDTSACARVPRTTYSSHMSS